MNGGSTPDPLPGLQPRPDPAVGAPAAGELLPRRGETDPDTTLMSNPELVAWLRAAIEEARPVAVTRFGDAEARVLDADRGDRALRAATGLVQREAGLGLAPESVLELHRALLGAFERADVLGIRYRDRLPPDRRQWPERLNAIYAERRAAGRPAAILAPRLCSHHLLGPLPEAIAGRRVSAITCRDLEPVLETEWGLEDVVVYQVPSQYSARDVDGPFEAAMHGVPIWPDAHARLERELVVRERGEVFLVGAGIFGKDLCVRVRELGGIAIDMGSALDHIAGRPTRGPERRALELHAAGMPAAEIASTLSRIFEVRVETARVESGLEPLLADVDRWRADAIAPPPDELLLGTIRAAIGDAERSACLALGRQVEAGAPASPQPLGIWWGAAGAGLHDDAIADMRRRGLPDLRRATVDAPALRAAVARAFPAAQIDEARDPAGVFADVRRALERHGGFADERAATRLVALSLAHASARRRRAPAAS